MDRWDWAKVEEAFARFDRYRVLAPALVAMRKLAKLIERDPAFTGVDPLVSHASLRLRRENWRRELSVSWHEGDQYAVYFIDPPLEFCERELVREADVMRVLRERMTRLETT